MNRIQLCFGGITGQNKTAREHAEASAKTRAQDEVKRELKAKKAAEARAAAAKANKGPGGNK